MLSLKKKDQETSEDELIEEMAGDNVPKPSKLGASVGADIERLKAQVDAINEMRKAYSEKFNHTYEQIGELRNMLIEKEKVIRNIEVKAIQASDLVNSVQPEKLLLEIKKEDVKIESIRSKLESYGLIAEKIREELKEIRDHMSTFRGIEETIKLNKDVKTDIMSMKKIESSIEIHADKVEKIFGEVQVSFNEFKKYEERSQNLDKSFKDVMKGYNEIKTKSVQSIQKSEFEIQKKEMNEKMLYFDKTIQEMKTAMSSIQNANEILLGRIGKGQSINVSEQMHAVLTKEDLQKSMEEVKKEMWQEIGRVNVVKKSYKNDTSKATRLIEEAKNQMKNKNTEQIKIVYAALKEEYETLSSAKKNDIYDEVKQIYDWLSEAE